MAIEIIPAAEVALTDQARLFSAAFAGYIGGSFTMDATALAAFFCAQGIDLCHSRLASFEGALCGFGYINRTGEIARLAGMGVTAPARRRGVAQRLLGQLLEEARHRSDRAMVLEVIEQNPAAVALYEKEGFRVLTRLCGWRRAAGHGLQDPSPALEEIPLLVASQRSDAPEYPALPWQISRHAVAKFTSARAFALSHALAVISDPAASGPIRVQTVSSTEILGALLARYPEREFIARPLFPEELGEKIFAPLGFTRESLTQKLMRRDL